MIANNKSGNILSEATQEIFNKNEDALGRRSVRRVNTRIAGTLIFGNPNSSLECIIRDLSGEGARIRLSSADLIPKNVTLVNPRDLAFYEASVIWQCGELVGLAFDNTIFLD